MNPHRARQRRIELKQHREYIASISQHDEKAVVWAELDLIFFDLYGRWPNTFAL